MKRESLTRGRRLLRGQVAFDFLIALSALAVLFTALLSVAYAQSQQSSAQASRLVMERTCEIISQKLVSAKINGDGAIETFYSKIPLTLSTAPASREIYLSGTYLCLAPVEYDTQITGSPDGEFRIENRNSTLFILQ